MHDRKPRLLVEFFGSEREGEEKRRERENGDCFQSCERTATLGVFLPSSSSFS